MSFRFAWTGLPIGGVFCYTAWNSGWYSNWHLDHRPNWFRNWYSNDYSNQPSLSFSIEQQHVHFTSTPNISLDICAPVMKVSCTGNKGAWKKFMDENDTTFWIINLFLLFACPPLFVILFVTEILIYNEVDFFLYL